MPSLIALYSGSGHSTPSVTISDDDTSDSGLSTPSYDSSDEDTLPDEYPLGPSSNAEFTRAPRSARAAPALFFPDFEIPILLTLICLAFLLASVLTLRLVWVGPPSYSISVEGVSTSTVVWHHTQTVTYTMHASTTTITATARPTNQLEKVLDDVQKCLSAQKLARLTPEDI
jgi:hypothetical protein